MMRMIDNETLNGSDSYTLMSMMTDLRNGIWSEVRSGRNIDTYRRNLQRAHVERLGTLMVSKDVRSTRSGNVTVKQSDIIPVVRGELNRLKRMAQNGSNRGNTITRYHLQDIVKRIDAILDPK